jgi:hypothetical protein
MKENFTWRVILSKDLKEMRECSMRIIHRKNCPRRE